MVGSRLPAPEAPQRPECRGLVHAPSAAPTLVRKLWWGVRGGAHPRQRPELNHEEERAAFAEERVVPLDLAVRQASGQLG